MKVLYVAKHSSGGNDDEGAIAHALRELGHTVIPVRERPYPIGAHRTDIDLVLFHHWKEAPQNLNAYSAPTVFWYFDLVSSSDRTLSQRMSYRRRWIEEVTSEVSAGFCTDGDWVAQDRSGKLTRLCQGADGRIVGEGTRTEGLPPIIFPGTPLGNGMGRTCFVALMSRLYGDRFENVRGSYRRALADRIASAEVIVCPTHPVSNHYWSNRVYLTAGFGGLTIHPYAASLRDHFTDTEVPMYSSELELQDLVALYRHDKEARDSTRLMALERVRKEHLYRHRVERMLEVLKSKGIV